MRPHLAAPAAALVLAACAGPPARKPAPADAPSRVFQGTLAASAEGGFETGRLTSTEQVVAGPFVLTYLAPGAELEVASTAPGGTVLGRVLGPLAQPLHVAAGSAVRLPGPGEAVYAGYRPMPITRPLDAYLGRQVLLGARGTPPETWTLREIGGDHLTVERSRTYRVLPVRRIAEITWTDLTGIDPTPRIVLAPD
jgi:hypothetical protein